jgi:hypothetical protein
LSEEYFASCLIVILINSHQKIAIMMKRVLSLLLFFSIFSLNAQNWKPFNSADKYNYFIAQVPYATVWVDSAKILGTDSVFFLNKVLKKINQTSPPVESHYLLNQSQCFLSEMIYQSNGETVLKDGLTKLHLKTLASLNESWVFDSVVGDIASVISITTATLFGQTDSVKIIKISSNDTIIISKNFGIIMFPLFDANHQHIKLAGIEGRGLGTAIPKFKDFFDFNIGDIFYYEYNSEGHTYSIIVSKKIHIINKEINGDTIKYDFEYSARNIHNNFGLPSDTSYYNAMNSVTYIDSNSNFLNKYNHQIVGNNVSGMFYKPVNVAYNALFQTITKSYPFFPFCKDFNSDTIIESSNPYICSSVGQMYIYGKGVGLIQMSRSEYTGTPYSNGYSEELVGCIKNGVLYGEEISQDVFTNPDDIFYPLYTIFPSPVINALTIKIKHPEQLTELTIYDIKGQEVIKQRLRNIESKIDVESLNNGVYTVKLVNKNWVAVKKIFKK